MTENLANAKPRRVIRKGSSDATLLALLKRHHKGIEPDKRWTVADLAAVMPRKRRRRGSGDSHIKESSLRAQLSKLFTTLTLGKDEQVGGEYGNYALPEKDVLAIFPKDYGSGPGRRAGGEAIDDIAALFGDDADDDTLADILGATGELPDSDDDDTEDVSV